MRDHPAPFDEEDTELLPEQSTAEPPESAIAVEDYGVTGFEESHHEPLRQRLRREVPERGAGFDGTDLDLPAEQAAMHVLVEPAVTGRVPSRGRKTRSLDDRLDMLEAQVTVLLTIARIHTEALQVLAQSLQRSPLEEPGDAAVMVSNAAHRAYETLLALRNVPT